MTAQEYLQAKLTEGTTHTCIADFEGGTVRFGLPDLAGETSTTRIEKDST